MKKGFMFVILLFFLFISISNVHGVDVIDLGFEEGNVIKLNSVEETISPEGNRWCQASSCGSSNYESDEGSGGQYCCGAKNHIYEGYEECRNPFIKSTAHTAWDSGTDYCESGHTLKEAYIDCNIGPDYVEFDSIDCNDYDGYVSSDWIYYCEGDRVLKKKWYVDSSCSNGRCISSGSWKIYTVVRNGESGYCKKRRDYGCSPCSHGEFDCDYDNECSGSLKCKGPILGAMDGCCYSDETWDSDKQECVGACECSSGSCCDGCNYRSSSYICDSSYGSYEYSCKEGNCLGDDVYRRDKKRYCSGSSSSCSGSIVSNNPVIYDGCSSSNEFCSGSTSWSSSKPSCKTAECTSGDCCDSSCGNYEYKSSSVVCKNPYQVNYDCSSGSGVSYPGSDVKKKSNKRYCSGSSSSCSGSVTGWTDWIIYDYCSSNEYCTDDDSSCNSCGHHTISSCYSNDVYWYDNCFNREDKKQECGSLGCANGACKSGSIECSKDSDCGNNGWTGSSICKYDDVYQYYKFYDCTNPGTTSSDCTSSNSLSKKQECGSLGCANGACKSGSIECSKDSDCGNNGWIGSAGCQNNDVYQSYKTYDCTNPGSTSSDCTYSISLSKKKECGTEGCANGVCKTSVSCPSHQYENNGVCKDKYTYKVGCGGSSWNYQCIHYTAGAQTGCYNCKTQGTCGSASKIKKNCYDLKGDASGEPENCKSHEYDDNGVCKDKYTYKVGCGGSSWNYQCIHYTAGAQTGCYNCLVRGTCGSADKIKKDCFTLKGNK